MCRTCTNVNSWPYELVVATTACAAGGLEETVQFWQDLVADTLRHQGIGREQFDADVATVVESLDSAG